MSEYRAECGKPSEEKRWLKYYPQDILNLQIPECSVEAYLRMNCPGEDVTAIHYYGTDITWKTFFAMVDKVEKSFRAIGLKKGDQIPVFLRNVPEFLFLLLAAERIGASLLCRDNTLEENVEAVAKSGAQVIFAQDFLSREEQDAYLGAGVKTIVLISPCFCCRKADMPEHILNSLQALYPQQPASGEGTMSWIQFMVMGSKYTGSMERGTNIHQPLYRAYTSGSTGPSKQVIHSANSIISVVHQMNFYGAISDFRPTWLVTALPPALVAVVVSMVLAPLSSNKLLILDPFVDPMDVDLELMRYQPNIWPGIPMFLEVIMDSKRIPADYDMSFLASVGAGAEAYNNVQIRRVQKFLEDHNCTARFTTGYGSSEAGSSITMPMIPGPYENGCVGVPLPLTTMGIFKPGTQVELGYNQLGEICRCGPGNMLGYDSPEATAQALQVHPDGKTWLHIGDTGYIDENGVIFSLGRGAPERFGGGELPTLPMENLVADAKIPGIDDEFFVIVEDQEHPGYHVPYLFVVLNKGFTIGDVQPRVMACLPEHQRPVKIYALKTRPFFHFKTNRIGLAQEVLKRERERMAASQKKTAVPATSREPATGAVQKAPAVPASAPRQQVPAAAAAQKKPVDRPQSSTFGESLEAALAAAQKEAAQKETIQLDVVSEVKRQIPQQSPVNIPVKTHGETRTPAKKKKSKAATVAPVVLGVVFALLLVAGAALFTLYHLGVFALLLDSEVLQSGTAEEAVVSLVYEEPEPAETVVSAEEPQVSAEPIVTPPAEVETEPSEEPVEPRFALTSSEEVSLETLGQTAQIEYVVEPTELQKDVQWECSDGSVALVDDDGMITARRSGDCTVTGTCGDLSISVQVHCGEGVAAVETELNYFDITMSYYGEQVQMRMKQELDDAELETIVWTSSDPEVATVDENGMVVGVGDGKTIITAETDTYTASCIVRCVNVSAGKPANSDESDYRISHEDVTMTRRGETFTLTLKDQQGEAVSDVTWSSSNTGIATVDKNGVVTAVSSGTCTITTTVDGDKFECIVRVRIS